MWLETHHPDAPHCETCLSNFDKKNCKKPHDSKMYTRKHPYCPRMVYEQEPSLCMWFQALKMEWKTGKVFHTFCEDELLEISVLDEIVSAFESIDNLRYFETLSVLLGGAKRNRAPRQRSTSVWQPKEQ